MGGQDGAGTGADEIIDVAVSLVLVVQGARVGGASIRVTEVDDGDDIVLDSGAGLIDGEAADLGALGVSRHDDSGAGAVDNGLSGVRRHGLATGGGSSS